MFTLTIEIPGVVFEFDLTYLNPKLFNLNYRS